MFDQLLTMESLRDIGVMAGIVYLIVNYTKSMIKSKFPDYFVRIYALIISWAVLGFSLAVNNDFNIETIGLCFLNGFVVAMLAMSGQELIKDPLAEKSKQPYSN